MQRSDYRVDSVGGSSKRWDALRAGSHQVALLPTPLDLVAAASGLNVLARVDRELGAYQGVVAAVRRRWADEHSAVIEGYVRALMKALRFLREPGNGPAAVALLKGRVEGMSEDLAQESLRRMLDPVSGFSVTGRIDPDAVGTVIALRRKYGRNPSNLAEPGAYLRPVVDR
jgi:ABC-type nitrate/sulfonate/bicarbonate transport system substrate-binding protein